MDGLIRYVTEGPVLLRAGVVSVFGLVGVFAILVVFYVVIRILVRGERGKGERGNSR